MSCSLNLISQIHDVKRIEALLEDLFVEEQNIIDKGVDDFDQDWGDDWDSTDEFLTEYDVPAASPTTVKKPWLQNCTLSLSPSEEICVIAKDTKSIILAKKWTTNKPTEHPQYEVIWSGNLSSDEEDKIRCVQCAPLASQQRSSEGNPDWTCIIVGFSSGYIRIFTTNGTQLLAQILHHGPVLSIKLKTRQHFFIKDSTDQPDELLILYPDSVVTIDGFDLYQTLRACRSQLANAQASFSSEVIESSPLQYRKWRLGEQQIVDGIASCGIVTPCLFDRLQTGSYRDGPHAKVKGSSPALSHFVTTGRRPFIAVYQASQENSPLYMSDVAMAVASKLTSAVFSKLTSARGWFGGGNQTLVQPTGNDALPKVEKGNRLPQRYCLHDSHRHAENIVVSPIGHLATVTDAFNRVLLFDTVKGIVIRMWKGYRDAECGWVVVEEEKDETDNTTFDQNKFKRRALFLVIYAPKRGILEIYLTEHGTRVGAFNVGKDCRFIYQGYRSLGETHYTGNASLSCNDTNQCFLMQCDGSLKSIHVPFHCALSTIHSVRAKDLHLLKKLSNLIERSIQLENKEDISKSLVNVLLDIQVPNTQRKAVKYILSSSSFPADFLQRCIQKIIKQLKRNAKQEKEEDLEYESERQDLLQYCHAQQQLIDMFIAVEELKHAKEGPDSEFNNHEDEESAFANLLHVTLSESQELLFSIKQYKEICLNSDNQICRHIDTISSINIAAFLSCFHVEINTVQNGISSSTKKNNVGIRDNLSKEMSVVLGSFLFEAAINGTIPVSKLTLILELSRLPAKQIMILLVMFTQSESSCNLLNLSSMYYLHSMVSSISSIKGGPESNCVDMSVGEVSMWWQAVRDILLQSVLIGQSLTMAVICRSIAIEQTAAAQKIKMQDESDIASGGWESVTVDIEQWNFIVCQLENLLALECFVHSNHAVVMLSGIESPTFKQHFHSMQKKKIQKQLQTKEKRVPPFDSVKAPERMPTFSIKGILDGGYGAIAQIVADCLVRVGIPGPCLRDPRPGTIDSSEGSYNEEDDLPDQDVEPHEMLAALAEIREKFPYSLEQDILWVHCAWESIMVWNEDVEDVPMLSSALIHLKCIHHPLLQQGLAVMMWKAVYKESIKSLTSLIEKIGRAPKDRLCKKTVGLSYKALEDFLSSAKQLLTILIEIELSDNCFPEFKTEDLWIRKESQRSIVEQAVEEPLCNPSLLKHFLCLVTSLYLIMQGSVKGIKPFQLFDTKGRHAFLQPLHATPPFAMELDDTIMKARKQFCLSVVTSIIKNHLDLTSYEEIARNNTTQVLILMDILLELARTFSVDDDLVRRYIACELYTSGLDIAAQEMAMFVQNKDEFSLQMMDVVGFRLKNLLVGDADKVSDAFSKLSTKVSDWLNHFDCSKRPNLQNIPLLNTYHLLQYLHSNSSADSKNYKFINELIECLKMFL